MPCTLAVFPSNALSPKSRGGGLHPVGEEEMRLERFFAGHAWRARECLGPRGTYCNRCSRNGSARLSLKVAQP